MVYTCNSKGLDMDMAIKKILNSPVFIGRKDVQCKPGGYIGRQDYPIWCGVFARKNRPGKVKAIHL